MAADRFQSCLVLSGGAARAMAHVGVLQQLEALDHPIDMIVGTSMGALVGALYAIHRNADQVSHLVTGFLQSDPFKTALAATSEEQEESDSPFDRFIHHVRKGVLYTRSLSRISLVSHNRYQRIVAETIPDRPIESLPLPFAAVATDLLRGEEVVLTHGSLLRAVQASAAIPGILPPVSHQGRYLIDGGWVDNTPVAPALRLGAHFTIAVDASWDVSELRPLPDSALELAFRSSDITRMALNRLRRAPADVLLVPDVGHVLWSDFGKTEICIQAGRAVVTDKIGLIRRRTFLRKLCTLGGWLRPFWRRSHQHDLVLP